jgi:outer membrane protein assembly factor BamB
MTRTLSVMVVALACCQGAAAQDSEAEAALRGADAAREQGKADRAVDLYRLALDADAAAGHGVALVESGRWIGVTEAALAGLRALPPDAVKVFRARYDERAATALAEARVAAEPYAALASVYERYPISSVAPRALEAVAEVALAREHRARARAALARLLEHHAAEVDEASVRARLAGLAEVPALATAPVIGAVRFEARTFLPGAAKPGPADTRHAPLVHGGRVFVPTADDVLTYDLRTGEDGPRIPRTGVLYDDPNPKARFGGAVDGSTFVVPLVHVVHRAQQFRGIPIKAKIPLRKLAGFDLEGWQWSWNHADLLDDTPLVGWSFPCPPVALDGAVFAPAFEIGQPLISSFVAAFDAKTGERLWDRRVGQGEVERTTFGDHATEPLCTPVAVSGGIVYHSTSFGTVAALDASSGRPLWTSAYEVIETRAPRGYYADARALAWENNAPVVQSGVVVVTPLDSQSYYGFDARTGARLWSQRQRATPAQAEVRFVMGSAELDGQGLVVLAGGGEVRCVAARTGKLLWSAQLRGRVVAGRGCVAGGVVLVPVDRDEVFTFDLATGKRLGAFPVGATGNVTLAGEHVLVTGNGVLAVHAAGP